MSLFMHILRRCDSFLEKSVILFLSVSCVPPAVVCLLPGVLIFLGTYRLCVLALAKLFHKETLVKPLQGLSSIFAAADDIYQHPENGIVAAIVLEGVPDINHIRNLVRERIIYRRNPETGELFYPEITHCLEYFAGFPFWKKIEQMTENHLLAELIRIHKSKNSGTDDDNLNDFLRELSLRPFFRNKPLLEVEILENYKSPLVTKDKPHFVFAFRTHHSVSDGTGLALMLLNLSMNNSNSKEIPKPIRMPKQNHTTGLLSCIRLLYSSPRMCYELVEFCLLTFVLCGGKPLWGRKVRSKEITKHTLFMGFGKPLDITLIKQIRQIHRVSTTSVLISTLLRATRSAIMSDMNPLPTYGVVGLPMALPGHDGKLRNKFTCGNLRLPFQTVDPVEHVKQVDQAIKSLKASSVLTSIALLSNFAALIPRWTIPRSIKQRTEQSDFLALSNIIAPSETGDLCGYPIRRVLVCSGLAMRKRFLMFYLVTAAGGANFSIVADEAIVSSNEEVEETLKNIETELRILQGHSCLNA